MGIEICGSIIAALHDSKDLDRVLKSNAKTVFLLSGELTSIEEKVRLLQNHNKEVFLHVDLVKGLGSDPEGVMYTAKYIKPDGIITTRGQLVVAGRDYGLKSIQRIFALDSRALSKSIKSIEASRPDAIEVLPGLLPKVIAELRILFDIPIITGGLISSRQEAVDALRSGANAVSTSNVDLW